MALSRLTGDLLSGTWSLISDWFQAISKRLLWDEEAGIGWRGKLARGTTGLMGTVVARFAELQPVDPKSKGIVEWMNG